MVSPFDQARPPSTLRPRWDVVSAVFIGGCLGGLARYGITSAWATPSGRFPWATFNVNLAGAFVLALVIVAAAETFSPRYLRPLLGTGLCGAFTTFSSIVVTTDELVAHDHVTTAFGYLAASVVGGLAAAGLGLGLARAVILRRFREEGNGR